MPEQVWKIENDKKNLHQQKNQRSSNNRINKNMGNQNRLSSAEFSKLCLMTEIKIKYINSPSQQTNVS